MTNDEGSRLPIANWGVGICAREAGEVHASEGAAANAVATPIGLLMSGHVLRDGELVLMMLRPSRWFILLTSLRWVAAVLIGVILAVVFDDRLNNRSREVVELGAVLILGRLVWALMQWMGRYYILTDMRILRLAGVFSVEIFDCPLRRVARTILEVTFKEQLCRVGSIMIIPEDEQFGLGYWQMVAKPREVREQIVAAIVRAKQSGVGG